MPYVSNGESWGIGDSRVHYDTRAGTLFKPIGGVLPAGILTVGAFSATAQAFTNLATHLWNSGVFNTQGQRWVGVDGTPANGCRNEATPRTVEGSRYNHITELEFLYTGQDLDVAFIGSASYEVRVYVEHNSRMYRAEAAPKAGTTTGLMHLPLNFAATYHGRIRVVLAGGLFVGVKCEQSDIVKKSPDRIFAICDGAEWSEGAGFKQASGTSYLVQSLTTYLFERTGFVWAQRAQPDTGWFRNGSATVADDTASSTNQSRFFSQNRKDWVAADFADKPLFYLITGSRADGTNTGATGESDGPLATRAKACFDWVRSRDRHCKIVTLSVAPFTGESAGTGHALNFAELAAAAAATSRAESVDATTWWNAAQQVPLIGADGINPNDLGFNFWASRIATELAQMTVNVLRARRLK
ncbi:MAG: hypothetical protein U5N53_28260 [Mycobacterium sp.]|nr:hypothetical protein [Mycobacterium sp.]